MAMISTTVEDHKDECGSERTIRLWGTPVWTMCLDCRQVMKESW
jgi:hypothetical protein